jgi:hypothetical protein
MFMKNLKTIATLLIILLATIAKAQNETDVLRYSFTNVVGSARSMACGNAFGAIGADYSGMVTNPAGLARYRKSEIGLTANFFNTQANSFYIDNTRSDSKFNLNINNAGLAIAIPTGNKSGWRFVNLGFGVNRIANFNKSVYMEGINTKSSIVQHFEQTANGTDYANLGVTTPAYLAYQAYLIDPQSGYRDQYVSDFTYDSAYSLHQRNSIEQSGGMNDISLALSGNYDDKVYLGGSMDFYKVRYSEVNSFLEDVMNNSVNNYKRLNYTPSFSTKGMGIGAKIGAIFLPTEYLRVGIAYHTPSRLYLEDNYSTTMSSRVEFSTFTVDTTQKTKDGIYDYSITIPGRIALSAAYIYNKSGFISIDYERIDYRNGKLQPGTDQTSALDTFTIGVNNNVQKQYKAANNIRIGAEYTFDVYAVRAGIGFTGSPYNTDASGPSNFKTSIPFISCGFGIRNGNYFLDMALVRNYATNYYAPYTLNPGGTAKYYTSEIQSITTNFTVSIGFKF